MNQPRIALLVLLATLFSAHVRASGPMQAPTEAQATTQTNAQTEGERRFMENKEQALRLLRDASDPQRPLTAAETIIPDVDDLAQRFKRTKAKLKPEYLAAYRPGPAHEVLRAQGCEVLEATPMGTPIDGKELHIEYIAFRCSSGDQGTLTVSRNAPPEVKVSLDGELITDKVAGSPAIVRYFRAQQSRRLAITQSWMAGPNYLLTLQQALPVITGNTQRGMAWSKARYLAEALHQAYAAR